MKYFDPKKQDFLKWDKETDFTCDAEFNIFAALVIRVFKI